MVMFLANLNRIFLPSKQLQNKVSRKKVSLVAVNLLAPIQTLALTPPIRRMVTKKKTLR